MCEASQLRSFAASQLRRHIFSKDKKELFIINDVGLSVPSQNRGPEEETILNFEYTGWVKILYSLLSNDVELTLALELNLDLWRIIFLLNCLILFLELSELDSLWK